MQKIYYLKVRYKLNIWILTYFWNQLTILYFILEFGGVVRNESYTVYKYILSEKSVILFPVTGRWWCTFTGMMNLSVSQYEDVYLVPCCVASVQTAAVSVSYQSRKLLYLWKKERKIPYSVTDKSGSQWCILEKIVLTPRCQRSRLKNSIFWYDWQSRTELLYHVYRTTRWVRVGGRGVYEIKVYSIRRIYVRRRAKINLKH